MRARTRSFQGASTWRGCNVFRMPILDADAEVRVAPAMRNAAGAPKREVEAAKESARYAAMTPALRSDAARTLAAACTREVRACDGTAVAALLRAATEGAERAALSGILYAPMVVAAARGGTDGATIDPLVVGSVGTLTLHDRGRARPLRHAVRSPLNVAPFLHADRRPTSRRSPMSHAVNWFQIQGPNGHALQQFYKQVFGWKMKPQPGGGDAKMVAAEPGGMAGGVGTSHNHQPGVAVYISVGDIDAVFGKIQRGGGRMATPKTKLPGAMGSIAGFTDPAGNWVGLWMPGKKAAPKGGASARKAGARRPTPTRGAKTTAKRAAAKKAAVARKPAAAKKPAAAQKR